ncbi:MAG: glycosyltransferase [Candidatus Acidiferrum sp.]
MPPRHILYLIDELNSLEGGAERSLWLTTQLLPPDRYRATVVTFKEPTNPSCHREFSCPVRVFPLDRTYDFRAVRTALKLRRLIHDENVEIVQTFFESSDLWGGLIAKLSGCPVLISSRRDMGFRRVRKHQRAYRLLTPMFDCIHTVSDAVRDYTILQDRADPRAVITIPNGVEIETAHQNGHLRSHYRLEKASHVVLDVTSVRRVKGIDTFIHAAERVRHQFPHVLFVIAGPIAEPQYLAELNKLLSELDLGRNVRFLGGVQPIFPLLNMCDVFCHLARSDGLSNALLEGMACGLPCVVSRAGGNPEVIEEGHSGFIVPIDDPDLAADRIITLLRYPDCARRMGRRGREIINERFTAKRMVEKFVKLYDQLMLSKRTT